MVLVGLHHVVSVPLLACTTVEAIISSMHNMLLCSLH